MVVLIVIFLVLLDDRCDVTGPRSLVRVYTAPGVAGAGLAAGGEEHGGEPGAVGNEQASWA
jgi:hypothetical protein